jgi:hypothetical protein
MNDRVQAAQAEALRRFRREGRQLAPLRWWVVVIVVVVAVTSKPAVGLSGRHLALVICLVVFAVEMVGWPLLRPRFPDQVAVRVGELAVFGASAVAIAVLQPNGLADLPASAVVFVAGVALSPSFAIAIGAAVTVGVRRRARHDHRGRRRVDRLFGTVVRGARCHGRSAAALPAQPGAHRTSPRAARGGPR